MENMKSTSAFIGWKWHAKFCRSRIRRSGNQALVLVLCVALSVVTLAALSSFAESTNRSILNDARSLHASDIILRSNYPFEQSLLDEVERTKSRYGAQSARVYSFYSVVRSPDEENSLLVGIKAPEKGYPFYGEVKLASGRKFSDVLAPGAAIVEPMVLEGLGLRIGDEILVGNAGLTIEDAVLAEPDRPVNLFSLGPRVFVSFDDLDKLGLVTEASRVNYRLLAKVRAPEQLSEVFEVLKKAAGDHVGIDTFETARSSVKRFFNNFVFFLNLTGIFTLLLAGIGIRSTVEALLREETDSMAIMKTLGAKSRFILLNYTLVVVTLGVAGAILGLVAGLALQSYLPAMFADFLPKSLEIGVSVGGVARGLALGILSAALFALLPLLRLRNVKPTAIFGKEPPRQKKDVAFFAAAFFIACVFSALVLWQLNEIMLRKIKKNRLEIPSVEPEAARDQASFSN
jgi:putative ABC transport system permease protein